MRLWIVLPAFNEAQNLPAIFAGFRRLTRDTFNLRIEVILVNDASTDNTNEVAQQCAGELRLEILVNPENRGLAETLMRGVLEATKKADDEDVIVSMDADNTHIPGQILRMARKVQEGLDVVIASRYRTGAVVRGVPLHRRFLSRGLSLLFRIVYPVPGVRDYSSGFRAYRAAVLKETFAMRNQDLFARDGFACMVGILLRLHRENAVFGEIPIVLRYDQKEGASEMRISRTVFNTLGLLLRERFGGGSTDRQTR
jgi:dolichol-phosphate mannosyltransferase